MSNQETTVYEWKVFLNPEETEWTVLDLGYSPKANRSGEIKLKIGYWKMEK